MPAQEEIQEFVKNCSSTKEPNSCNGEKTASSTNVAGKTVDPHVEH
jgi:hypothetical protein